MPEAYVPDPNSPEAQSAWMRSVEDRLLQLKLRTTMGNQVLGYAQTSTPQTGLSGGTITNVTSLLVAVVVGSQRLIRITGFVVVIAQTALQLVTLYASEGASQMQTAAVELPAGYYGTLEVLFVVNKPTVGTHTYKLQAAGSGGGGTTDLTPTGVGPSFILVEDIGQAPA